MSHSMQATSHRTTSDGHNNGTFDSDDNADKLLSILTDADCRTILETISDTDDYLSASEVSDRCDVPLSTTYRKLDLLTDATVLEEQLRIRRSGQHVSEYTQRLDTISIAIEMDDGIAIELTS
ncbi:transcriptional regulator [Natrialba chahannaoensis JCM 10990]|uniref:Transcriptional regulator n=1 Tax=Natrialba chahannaoensis JCM 10990 TaxID=1227492 RepID=M0B3H5_9EURY|nr:helix-turn-helix domain-containing protein [Natrialba chahannaoensis]ELZ04793.1 transcriptional regulator [Natrialba chahannaoensis JCM 10990]